MADITLNRVSITLVRAYITLERIDITLERIVWYHRTLGTRESWYHP